MTLKDENILDSLETIEILVYNIYVMNIDEKWKSLKNMKINSEKKRVLSTWTCSKLPEEDI